MYLDTQYTLWPISFQLSSIQLPSPFPLGFFWAQVTYKIILTPHFDGLPWASKLLSVYMSKCKRNTDWKYIYLRLIWWKMWGIRALMFGAWRLNVGVWSCNASMCSSQFCLVWLRVPLIFHFWLAALRRTQRKHWKSLDALKALLDFAM